MLFRILFGTGGVVTCTVHEGPSPVADKLDRAENLRFIKDGFTLSAALFAPVWLATHRLWAWLGVYAAIVFALVGANALFGLSDAMTVAAIAGLHVLIGLEADDMERLSLERKGWTTLASVSGINELECERRFLETWLPLQPVLAPRPATTAVPSAGTVPGQARSTADRLAALWRPKA
jgi:hypothetical protein